MRESIGRVIYERQEGVEIIFKGVYSMISKG